MFRCFDHRAGHYALLLAVSAALCLPNLGGPSLWDIDEGHNAEAAREMLVSENWIVPNFNFQLRVDKPALLYWLQATAYQAFGVNEFAARLPSALAGLAAVLLTYELGRRLFGKHTGLLAGLMLASTVMFCAAAHFANPDALLNACTLLTLLIFWAGYVRGGRGWFVPAGAAAGLAVLAKGPIGFVLPALIVALFLLWSRQLRLLWDRRLVLGLLAYGLVAGPWYAAAAAETKFDFLRGFLLTHNVGRYLSPMEGHGGPPWYYLAALLVGFAPWSVLLGPAAWYGIRDLRSAAEEEAPRPALRFLWCWLAAYLVFFSLAGTKLPNYILPAYAPAALLTAHFLARWRQGAVRPPVGVVYLGLGCVALIGVGTGLGLLAAGGALDVPALRGRTLPGLERGAGLGAVLVFGAVAAAWCLHRRRYGGVVTALVASAVGFVGALAAWGAGAVDAHKAPRPLVQALHAEPGERECRVACYAYYQPSLVFYCHRQVGRLTAEAEALEFLNYPLQVYLFLPAAAWEDLAGRVGGPHHILGRHRDLYRGCDVVVVTNR
jgi:4-amino-4-deoxy-L-arabinose transferase-like glycosyltransferase